MTNFINNIVYLDNVIFHRLHRRLSDRNYGCRRRPIYLIFSQFSIYCCKNACASGALLRTPPGASNVGSRRLQLSVAVLFFILSFPSIRAKKNIKKLPFLMFLQHRRTFVLSDFILILKRIIYYGRCCPIVLGTVILFELALPISLLN